MVGMSWRRPADGPQAGAPVASVPTPWTVPGFTRLGMALAASALLSASAGCSGGSGPSRSSGSPNDWIAAVCSYGPDGTPPMCRGHDDPAEGPLAFSPLFTILGYDSVAEMQQDGGSKGVGFGSAQCVSRDGSVVVFVADVSGIGDRSDAVRIAAKSMQPLDRFGCTINEAAPSTRRPSVAAPAPAPPPAPAQHLRRGSLPSHRIASCSGGFSPGQATSPAI